jgi:hypothetical protein
VLCQARVVAPSGRDLATSDARSRRRPRPPPAWRGPSCPRRLDSLVFTTLTGHCPAHGEANAEDDEDDCRSRTGAGRPCWGRSAEVRPAAGTPSPRTRPGAGPKTAAGPCARQRGGHRRRTVVADAEAHGRGDDVFVGEFGQGLVKAVAEHAGDLPEPAGRLGAGCLFGGGGLGQDLRPLTAFLARISSRFFAFKPAERKRLRHPSPRGVLADGITPRFPPLAACASALRRAR